MENIGFFAATKVNWFSGNIQYLIIFGKNELVFAKIGGQFSGINSKASMGLVLGGTVGALAAGKMAKAEEKQTVKKSKTILDLEKPEIIELDGKNNFSIPYSEIEGIEFKNSRIGINGARTGILKICGRKCLNFDIPVETDFEKAKSVIEKALLEKFKQ